MKRRTPIYLFLLFFAYSKCEILSYEENIKRLELCGQKFLEKPNKKQAEILHSENDWIVKVRTKSPREKVLPTTGSFISSRHVITSAQSVVTGEKKWGLNGKNAEDSCLNSKEPLEVPEEIVNHIEIIRGDCENGQQCEQSIGADKAFILGFCDGDSQFDRMFKLMIVEVKSYKTKNFACISNETTKVDKLDLMDVFGFDGDHLMYRLLEISESHNDYLLTSKYYVEGDRGGPMVSNVDGRATIVGIGASPGYNDKSSDTWFFDLRSHYEQICNISGVCVEGDAPSTTSTVATTTEIKRIPTESSSTFSSSSPSTSRFFTKSSTRIPTSTEMTILTTTKCQFDHEEEKFGELDHEKDEEDFEKSSARGFFIYSVVFLIMFYLNKY